MPRCVSRPILSCKTAGLDCRSFRKPEAVWRPEKVVPATNKGSGRAGPATLRRRCSHRQGGMAARAICPACEPSSMAAGSQISLYCLIPCLSHCWNRPSPILKSFAESAARHWLICDACLAPGLARRFGPDLLTEMDRAYGDSPDPQEWFKAPEHFQQKIRLVAQVESVELLWVPVQRMIDQMCGWLASRHAAVSSFSLVLQHEHSLRQPQRSTPIYIQLSEQSGDPGHLMLLLRERLERTKLAAPVCELELTADEITAGADANLELFPNAQSETTSLNRFIEKAFCPPGATGCHGFESYPGPSAGTQPEIRGFRKPG